MAKLEAQIRRYKEKIQDHRRTPHTGEGGRAARVEEPADE
jgi:ribosome-associated translation inhibitor RaiA